MSKEKVFEIIYQNIEDADFAGNIKMESIFKTENILNVIFPKSYKKFLSEFGCGGIFGIVSDDNIEGNTMPSVVWMTKELRNDGLPLEFVPISFADDGCYYVLNTGKMFMSLCWNPCKMP